MSGRFLILRGASGNRGVLFPIADREVGDVIAYAVSREQAERIVAALVAAKEAGS